MADLRDEKLDFWLKNGLNVLFTGRHGVGKTLRAIDAFKRANLKWLYFSCSTLDPWVDFVGVPHKVENNGKALLAFLMRPEMTEDLEVIFLDEYNRSHKKVRNATMELIQFKTINGRKFPNLKAVWAAINPQEEGDYQVDPIDGAQKDRFHVWVEVPHKCSHDYFAKKYNPEVARGAIAWWNELPEQFKLECSPRRLDYALEQWKREGDLRDILPSPNLNVSKLISNLANGPVVDRMKEIFKNQNAEAAKEFMRSPNNFSGACHYLCAPNEPKKDTDSWRQLFLGAMSPEQLSSVISKNDIAFEYVATHLKDNPLFNQVIEDIVVANQDKKIISKIKRKIGKDQLLASRYGKLQNLNATPPQCNKNATSVDWTAELNKFATLPLGTTVHRLQAFRSVIGGIPPNIDVNQSISTLEFLNLLCSRCHPGSLKKIPGLMGTINHCIGVIHSKTNHSWPDILRQWGSKWEILLKKLTEGGLNPKLYIPLPPAK